MKSKGFIYLYIILSLWISLFGIITGQRKILVFDNSGYHLYLPAVFIYHDIGKLAFYPGIDSTYWPTGDIKWYSIYDQPTGKKLNKYAIGGSLFEAPFFLVAHAATIATQQYKADGYSMFYELGAAISHIFWCLLALLLLQVFLLNYYNDKTVLLTLICICLGTNLFHQVSLGAGSHNYAFFLTATTLFLTQKWHASFRRKYLYLLGLVLGLTIILRPVDVFIALIPILWQAYDLSSLRQKMLLLKKNISPIILSMAIFFAVALIQISYWKYTTGHWIYFSYQGERFNFIHPHIIKGLFSYRKGWFIYTPMAFISVTGFYYLLKTKKDIALSILLTLIVVIYIVFSWENWWYGGGFASRPMVDFLPLIALPLAALIDKIKSAKKVQVRFAAVCIFCFVISLNLFQTWQYSKGIIHYDRMNKAYYWRIFGKLNYTEEDLQYLMNDKEYWDAMRAAYD